MTFQQFFIQLGVVGIGGALGSMARFGITLIIRNYFTTTFPFGTLIVNIVGSILIGGFAALWLTQGADTDQPLKKLVWITGFCGGFTTFSSFSLETAQMLKNGQMAYAIVYSIASFFICLLSVWLGAWLIKPSL